MLKNKLRKGLGKKDWAETGQTQTCWLLRSQVKGPFLYLLKQEVRIMLRLLLLRLQRHQWYQGSTQIRQALLSTSTNTVRPLVELHGTCYSVSNTIIWAKANNKKWWWHSYITAKSISNLHCSILAFHKNYNKIYTVQKFKAKVGYYKTAVSVQRCFLLLLKTYISEK